MLQSDKPPFKVIHLKTLIYAVQWNLEIYTKNMLSLKRQYNVHSPRLCNTSLQYQNTVSEWNLVHKKKHALCGEFPRTTDSGAPSRAAGRSIPLRDIAQRLSVLHYPVKQARNDLKHTFTHLKESYRFLLRATKH